MNIESKLQQLRDLRANNRRYRLKAAQRDSNTDSNQKEIEDYLDFPYPPRKEPKLRFIPVDFAPPPSPPRITRDTSCISSLSLIFPIGRLEDGDYWIVDKALHAPAKMEYTEEWKRHSSRIHSVFYYSARVLLLLSAALHRNLPYPVKFSGSRIFVEYNGKSYELSVNSTSRNFVIALTLLNADAAYFGGLSSDELLPNLERCLKQAPA